MQSSPFILERDARLAARNENRIDVTNCRMTAATTAQTAKTGRYAVTDEGDRLLVGDDGDRVVLGRHLPVGLLLERPGLRGLVLGGRGGGRQGDAEDDGEDECVAHGLTTSETDIRVDPKYQIAFF